jgi:hypothetical protein
MKVKGERVKGEREKGKGKRERIKYSVSCLLQTSDFRLQTSHFILHPDDRQL